MLQYVLRSLIIFKLPPLSGWNMLNERRDARTLSSQIAIIGTNETLLSSIENILGISLHILGYVHII